MAPSSNRMKKVYGGLSAQERALTVFRAVCDDSEEDPEIRLQMPRSQIAEFNRLIGLINAILRVIGPLATELEHRAQILNLKVIVFRTYARWSYDRLLLHRECPDQIEDESEIGYGPSAPWNVIPELEPSSDPVTGKLISATKGDLFAQQLFAQATAELPQVWGDLLALEYVFGEAQEELGTDQSEPRLKELFESTRKAVSSLAQFTGLSGHKNLVLPDQPDDERVDLYRAAMVNARGS